MKKALITGATGQIAAYLAHFLLQKDYGVYLTDRHTSFSPARYWRLEALGIFSKVKLIPASLDYYESLIDAMLSAQPNEIYHLAANSSITNSIESECSCMQINFEGTHRLLRAFQHVVPEAKFFFMGSSEQFGNPVESPQTENTKFNPRNPYGIAKTAAFELVKYYREHHGLFCCSAISYNQESPLRGIEFVTRKIVRGAYDFVQYGTKLELGNLDAQRDWGYVGDYVQAIWKMLQIQTASDFILATGKLHKVSDFVNLAFTITAEMLAKQLPASPEKYLKTNPKFWRQFEALPLVGQATKAFDMLDWEPRTSFEDLVKLMIEKEIMGFVNNG